MWRDMHVFITQNMNNICSKIGKYQHFRVYWINKRGKIKPSTLFHEFSYFWSNYTTNLMEVLHTKIVFFLRISSNTPLDPAYLHFGIPFWKMLNHQSIPHNNNSPNTTNHPLTPWIGPLWGWFKQMQQQQLKWLCI